MLGKLFKGTPPDGTPSTPWSELDWLRERDAVTQATLAAASLLTQAYAPQDAFMALAQRVIAASSQLRMAWYWLGDAESSAIIPTKACGPAAAYAQSLQFDLVNGHGMPAALRPLLTEASPVRPSGLSAHAVCALKSEPYGLAEMLAMPLVVPDSPQRGLLVLHAATAGYFQSAGIEAFVALSHYLEAVQQAAQLRRMIESSANADPLTSLLNRRGMQIKLTQLHAQYSSARRGAPRGSYLLFVDVDYFKQVNDYYGRDVGDRLIVEISQVLSSSLRGDDVLSRWSGEEFLVVLNHQPEEVARQVAERLRLAIASKPFKVGEEDLQITCSIGVAPLASDVMSTEQWVKLAENAAQRAKAQGANRISWA
jgi:diguanylate cyclase (GGDEF)-like protein